MYPQNTLNQFFDLSHNFLYKESKNRGTNSNFNLLATFIHVVHFSLLVIAPKNYILRLWKMSLMSKVSCSSSKNFSRNIFYIQSFSGTLGYLVYSPVNTCCEGNNWCTFHGRYSVSSNYLTLLVQLSHLFYVIITRFHNHCSSWMSVC